MNIKFKGKKKKPEETYLFSRGEEHVEEKKTSHELRGEVKMVNVVKGTVARVRART